MGNNEVDVVTRGDLMEFEQRIMRQINFAIQEEVDKNNSKLMTKIEQELFTPFMSKIAEIGKLVTLQAVDKYWVSKTIKNYLDIKVIKESKFEYDSIMSAYKAKLRQTTGKSITRLEDIPQTIENIKLLDDVCRFMYPKELNRGNLFKTRVNN